MKKTGPPKLAQGCIMASCAAPAARMRTLLALTGSWTLSSLQPAMLNVTLKLVLALLGQSSNPIKNLFKVPKVYANLEKYRQVFEKQIQVSAVDQFKEIG